MWFERAKIRAGTERGQAQEICRMTANGFLIGGGSAATHAGDGRGFEVQHQGDFE